MAMIVVFPALPWYLLWLFLSMFGLASGAHVIVNLVVFHVMHLLNYL